MKRIVSLDYLRGLAAMGIMIFHYTMWLFGLFTTNSFLGKVGIYGVAVFYVLSGLTLYHVYYSKIGPPSKKGLTDFALKRIFRIFPLLWLLLIVTLLISSETFSVKIILLNFTGLFSLIHWDESIVYGAWSIGNELVFYLFFPLFVFLSGRSGLLLALLSTSIFLIYLWFAFIGVNRAIVAGNFWVAYTNPLNQVFLFLGGYLIGHYTRSWSVPLKLTLPLIAAAVTVFIFLPVSGDATHLITGWYRLVFTLICFVVCFGFYKADFALPHVIQRIFEKLGEISYSLYLVHPVIWYLLSHQFGKSYTRLPVISRMVTGCIFSILAAYIIYEVFERYFMKAGKKRLLR